MPRVVKVRLVDAPSFLDKEYDYVLPDSLSEQCHEGSFVTVPFGGGNRQRMALVVGEGKRAESEFSLKLVSTVAASQLALSPEMMQMVSFLREQTLCTTGDAVHAILPAGALFALTEQYSATDKRLRDVSRVSPQEMYLYTYLQSNGPVRMDTLRARFGAEATEYVAHLLRLGLVKKELVQKNGMRVRENVTLTLAVDEAEAREILDGTRPLRLGEKQKALLSLICGGARSAESLRAAGYTKQQMDALEQKGLIRRDAVRLYRDLAQTAHVQGKQVAHEMSEEQKAALVEIERLATDGKAHGILLHGVTGSGKTYVMLRAIDGMLERGRGVIVLLPEIALTPQTLSIFCARYGERVAVMHSALSQGERLDAYHRILMGEATVVVGTRSAVFAPVKDLGLIVIDEEHEHTYKSDMNPKYHARDVARFRTAYNNALMLLCSATPSLESYKRALEGRYTLLKMKSRPAGATLPEVVIADMRTEPGDGNLSPLGATLCEALQGTMKEEEQAILFLNRRGYNHVVSCRSCGKPVTCPACSVSLTYHTKPHTYEEGELICHLCGRRQPMPKTCPDCGSEHLARLGYGTQRVEQELGTMLPSARVLRMDTDTTVSRYSYEEMLGSFRRHEADVLLGTQMVTKGHDFPEVTLVGVLMADSSLYLDDYRAAERTFSMLTQVVGRAGRAGKSGRAIIQTCNPDHDVIALACRQDYETFYEREIKLRRQLVFPPFCDIALLTLSHRNEQRLFAGAARLAQLLKDAVAGDFSDVKIIAFGPFEAPIYRAEGSYRMRMVIKCALNKRSREMFASLMESFRRQGGEDVLLSVDFNPTNL